MPSTPLPALLVVAQGRHCSVALALPLRQPRDLAAAGSLGQGGDCGHLPARRGPDRQPPVEVNCRARERQSLHCSRRWRWRWRRRWPWRPRWWRLRPWRIGGDHAALHPQDLHLSGSSRRKQLGPRAGWFVAERTVRTGRSAAAPHDCHSGNRNCPDVSGNSRSSRSRSTLDGLSPADEARSALHGFPCLTN